MSLAGSTAHDLLALLDRKEVSAVDVARAHLERIAAADPAVHAVLRLNPAAESEAGEQDALRRAGKAGPLCGVPVAIKDNLCTAGIETTAGSRILEGFVPVRDATAVARLRAAGAVILCKTNLDEFGMGSSTENSAFGPTRNPWDLARVPGGSSGGSAAAVVAGMAPLALGSDTGGSVRQPAAFCGLAGLKPTYGRVSRLGLIAFGSSLDQVGPLARTTGDCALALAALAGRDALDSTSSDRPVDSYREAAGAGVRGLTIGLPREFFGAGLDAEVEAAVRLAAKALEDEGAVIRSVSLPNARFSVPVYYLVATAEASSNLARYDGVRYGRRAPGVHRLREAYEQTRGQGFGAEVKRRIMLGTYALSAGYAEAFYGKALRVRTLLRRDFDGVFDSGVDALLSPTTPTPAFRIGEKSQDPLAMYLSDIYTVMASLAGVPALSVSCGRSGSGLPIGAQIVGPAFAESTLLRIAGAIESTVGRQDRECPALA